MTSFLYCLLILGQIHQIFNSPLSKQVITITSPEVISNIKLHPITTNHIIKLHDDLTPEHITKIVKLHVTTVSEIPKVHPIINLIPEVKNDEHAIAKNLLEVKNVREKKAYPIIGHVLIPTNIHYIPLQDLTVIPLRREAKPLFRSQIVNDYEPNVFQTYYGGYGNGLNFGGHGAGHGFYAYG